MLTNKDKLSRICVLCYVDNHIDINDWLEYNINEKKAERVFIIDMNSFGDEFTKNEIHENLRDNVTIITYNSSDKFNFGTCFQFCYDYAYTYIKYLDYDYCLVLQPNDYIIYDKTYLDFISQYFSSTIKACLFKSNIYGDNGNIYECKKDIREYDNDLIFKDSMNYSKYIVACEPWMRLGLYEPNFERMYNTGIDRSFIMLDSQSDAVLHHYTTTSLESYMKRFSGQNCEENINISNIIFEYFKFNKISKEKIFAIYEFSKKYNIVLSDSDKLYMSIYIK